MSERRPERKTATLRFLPNVTCAFPACCLPVLLWIAAPGECGNQALVSGAYAATLGAGGATAAERSAFGQNPAALRPGCLGLRLDFHRPYGMDELAVAEAGGFLDGSRWGVSAEWRQTAVEGLYSEQGYQITQSLRLGGMGGGFPGVLDLGLAWSGWSSQWPEGRSSLAWSHGLGAAWRPFHRLKAGVFMLGLPLGAVNGGAIGSGVGIGNGDATDRVWQWGLEADSRDPDPVPGQAGSQTAGPSQILRLDFRKTGNAPWRTLASLSIRPHPSLELTGGFSGPPFQASMGIRVAWAGWECRQALRYHRYLGRTWLSGLAYSRLIGVSRPN